MKIKFGPSGLGPTDTAIKTLEKYHELGLTACEIAFTYGPYIKDEDVARKIGEKAKELGISLSIHAPYFVNLNSAEEEKIESSKKRILRCLEIGTWMGVTHVVFHPGFYGKIDRDEAYTNIKAQMQDLVKKRKELGYTPKLAPEIMGKINVFGSLEEIGKLVKETGCSFCVDFAHMLAREKDYRFKDTFKEFESQEHFHIHFSGIEHGDKGEKRHLPTDEKDIELLLKSLPGDKSYTIINESPNQVADSGASLEIKNRLNL
ncbi:TIM barrel protein [Candidatus Pacearchaeota archaeon]|nr:TIM barrel protein [Candidatus Pacearchaeota archaeon]